MIDGDRTVPWNENGLITDIAETAPTQTVEQAATLVGQAAQHKHEQEEEKKEPAESKK